MDFDVLSSGKGYLACVIDGKVLLEPSQDDMSHSLE